MDSEDENILLSKWLNNELTAAERDALEKSGEADILRAIVGEVDNWTLPDLKEETFQKIKERTSRPREAKIVPLYRKPALLAAAASLILLVGLWWVFMKGDGPQENLLAEIKCLPGETIEVDLPDSTSVTLFGKSTLAYNPKDFTSNRKIKLEGECFFDVRKKGSFEVTYPNGTVRVLGTKFDVFSNDNVSFVKCFEGKVEVEMSSQKIQLQKGEGVRKNNQQPLEKFTVSEEITVNIESRFENAPLSEVCNSLSLYFDLDIVFNDVDVQRSFTGRFTRTNADTALTMVFTPMGIDFKREGKKVTLSNKK